MSQKRLATTLGVAMVLGSGLFALPASAEVIINIVQNTTGVVATGRGTIDLSGLTIVSGNTFSPDMNPSGGFISVGGGTEIDTYSGASGPSNFGSGGSASASSGTGDDFGTNGPGSIGLPGSYVSGNELSGSATWDGGTFSSVGLTIGTYTYTWTWGSGADDSLVVNIGTPVPEPATLSLLSTGILGLIGCAVVRRKRRSAGCWGSFLSA